jgi:hypothetical protein
MDQLIKKASLFMVEDKNTFYFFPSDHTNLIKKQEKETILESEAVNGGILLKTKDGDQGIRD